MEAGAMKLKVFTSILIGLISFNGITASGSKALGPKTLGQPSYPTSGPLRSRSTDMTGEDMSSSTHMGSDVDPTVPSTAPASPDLKQDQEEGPMNASDVFETGPYKDGQYIPLRPGPL
jgi:hypothetical protein